MSIKVLLLPQSNRRRSRERRRNQRETPNFDTVRVYETNRLYHQSRSSSMGQELLAPPCQSEQQQQSVISHQQQGSLLLPSYSCAIRSVSNYDNRAFSAVEEQSTDIVPSISMAVYENEISSHHECQTGGDNNEDDGIVMLHL